MNPTEILTIPEQVMAREVGGEAVILDVKSGMYYGLDKIGTRMWQLLAEGRTLDEVSTCILAEYDVSTERIENDLTAFVNELLDRGLIKRGNAQ